MQDMQQNWKQEQLYKDLEELLLGIQHRSFFPITPIQVFFFFSYTVPLQQVAENNKNYVVILLYVKLAPTKLIFVSGIPVVMQNLYLFHLVSLLHEY